MKILKERTEIAVAINYHKMPVITIDLADADECGLESCKVLIDAGWFDSGKKWYIESTVRAFTDEDEFKFSQGCCVLSNSFGYSDFKEMLEWRNAPIVKPDEDVIIAVYDSNTKEFFTPIILHTGKKLDRYCTIPLKFEDKDYNTGVFKSKVYDMFGMRKGIDSADLENNLEMKDVVFAQLKCRRVSKKDNSYEIWFREPYAYKGETWCCADSLEEVVTVIREAAGDTETWKEWHRRM